MKALMGSEPAHNGYLVATLPTVLNMLMSKGFSKLHLTAEYISLRF